MMQERYHTATRVMITGSRCSTLWVSEFVVSNTIQIDREPDENHSGLYLISFNKPLSFHNSSTYHTSLSSAPPTLNNS